MKSNVGFNLVGKDWNKEFWIYWILYLIFYIPNQVLTNNKVLEQMTNGTTVSIVSSLITIMAMVFLYPIFTVIFCKIILPRISLSGETFSFDGSISDLLKITLKGFLVSVVTIGIYTPWFIKKYIDYMANSISFKNEKLTFLSKGSILFVYLLFSFVLPFSLFLAGLFLFLVFAQSRLESIPAVAISTGIFTLLLYVPITYLTILWSLNYKWKNTSIYLTTKLIPTCLFMLSQIMLTLFTLGLYFPIAYIKIFTYFLNHLSFDENGHKKTKLSFCGSTKQGFKIIWIQTLLSIVSIGFYLPWAYAKIGSWIAASITIDDSPTQEITN